VLRERRFTEVYRHILLKEILRHRCPDKVEALSKSQLQVAALN
jgi:hypothetical protein